MAGGCLCRDCFLRFERVSLFWCLPAARFGFELLHRLADVGWLYGPPKGAGAEREQASAIYWSRCRWLVLAALSGLELSSRRVDGFVVAPAAALAGSYCVCWVSMALEKLKDVPVLGAFERGLVFCGQASLAIFAIHAVDWFIPWQTMPLLMTLPASWLFASIVRCACDIGLAYVIKKA